MAQVYEAIFEIFDRGVSVHQQQFKGPFTWEKDDPSARILPEGSFGLHAKTWLLGSTFHLDYMQDLCSTRLQSKMAASNDKSEIDNCLSASICHYICDHFQFSDSCLSFQLISVRIPPCCFSDLFPSAISGLKMVG